MVKEATALLLTLAIAGGLSPDAMLENMLDSVVPQLESLYSEPVPADFGVALKIGDHSPYMTGSGSGLFSPDAPITRAEAAVLLERLSSGTAEVTVEFSDVPAEAWYRDAALQMGSLNVLGDDDGTFKPKANMTRKEFAVCVSRFFRLRNDAELFTDVSPDDEDACWLISGRAWGWLNGTGDGTLHPDENITRSEVAALMNKALGRTGDREYVQANKPGLFLDVPVSSWYYSDIMEAVTPHEYLLDDAGVETWTGFTAPDTGIPADFRTEGWHLYDSWEYYYDAASGDILRDTTKDGRMINAAGHFTTGDSEVDAGLRNIVKTCTNDSMNQLEKLKALYAYVRDSYWYLKRQNYPYGDTSFTLPAAKVMLETGRGNCYCFASVFYYLARWIGYDAVIYSGTLEARRAPHSWVEIAFDGVPYIFDTQLEWRMVHDRGRTSYYWYFWFYRDSGVWFYRHA